MIDHILIAVGEERMDVSAITTHAVEIASAVGADVTLLKVYSDSEFKRRLQGFEYDSADPSDIAKRNSVVREAAHIVQEHGLELTIAGSVGDPVNEVSSYVEPHDIDHVFIGGRKRSPTGKMLLGSTSQGILTSLDVPCTVYMRG